MVATKFKEILPAVVDNSCPPEQEYAPMILPMVRFGFATLGRVFPGQAAKIGYKLFSTPRLKAVHKASDELLESARVFEFLYGKELLKAYEWGKGEQIILLVHGWESRGTALRSFVPGLVKEGFRVVAFDGPAHGNSPGKRTNLSNFAGAVLTMIRHLGGVHSIITHSFGGPTSVYALAHLDNSISVENIIFIAVPSSTQEVVRQAMSLMNLPPQVIEHFKKIAAEKVNHIPFDQIDILNALEGVKVRQALVVHDKNDTSVPFRSAEAIFDKYDHVSLLVTEGLGHFRLLKNQDVIDRVVSFISS